MSDIRELAEMLVGMIDSSPGTAEVIRDRYPGLDHMIDRIRREVKPAIEEPKEFGSIVRAVCLGGTDLQLWQRSYGDGKHYWESETGVVDVWSDLTDVEVLRVGLGEVPSESQRATQDDAYVLGAADMKARARKQFIQLASSAITSERKEAWRQAIEALEALS